MSYPENENPSFTVEEIEAATQEAFEHMVTWGEHTGYIRKWMQNTFPNGDTVMWGSQEQLGGSGLKVKEMEDLAVGIKNVVCKQFRSELHRALGVIKVRRQYLKKIGDDHAA